VVRPWPLYCQSNSPQYPLDGRLCGPQSRFERGGEQKKSITLLARVRYKYLKQRYEEKTH